jgi:hypothetical protein
MKKILQTEALKKLKTKMEADRISSDTVATSIAINKALANIEYNNTLKNATQIRISNLEKLLLQQTQTNKKILNQIKNRKNSQGTQQISLSSHSINYKGI